MSGLATARGYGTPYALQFRANAPVRWALGRVAAASASAVFIIPHQARFPR
jgi:hypothetical protein